MIRLPATLPNPYMWDLEPIGAKLTSDSLYGSEVPVQVRMISAIQHAKVRTAWRMTSSQYSTFKTFGLTDLLGWHSWFSMRTPINSFSRELIVRFAEMPRFEKLGENFFELQAILDVYSKQPLVWVYF